jgi:cytochrome P450
MTYEDITARFPYTQSAFLEALRLYPSVPNDMKYVVKDDVLPDGVKVTAGSNVIYLPFAMGSSPHLWGEDAPVFKPARMQGAKFSQFKYIAFNAGPRCVDCHGRTPVGQSSLIVQSRRGAA